MKNRKGFHKYIGQIRKTKETMSPLLNSQGKLSAEDAKKMELLNTYFASAHRKQNKHTNKPQQAATRWLTRIIWIRKGTN